MGKEGLPGRSPAWSGWLEGAAERLYAFYPYRDLGRRGEAVAARYLRRRGLRILRRNFHVRSGEIDLIALSGDTVVFIEVKARAGVKRGELVERIDLLKASRVRRAAGVYRRFIRNRYSRFRLDGVVVEFRPGFAGRPVPASVRWYPSLYPLDEGDS